jgi:type II secretory pathway component GspD/PulD (secretin)
MRAKIQKLINLTRKYLSVAMIMMISPQALAVASPFVIGELEFKDSKVADIIRVLSEDAKVNIVATPEAGKKDVTIFLKNVTLEEAIKSICRISDDWYRYDDSGEGTFRLMTKEEYSKDLILGQDDNIRVFQLRNPNVTAIAMAIQNLYAPRVRVSFNPVMGSGMGMGGMGGIGAGGRNGGFNNRGGMGNMGGAGGGFGGGMGGYGGNMGGGMGGYGGGYRGYGNNSNYYGGRNNAGANNRNGMGGMGGFGYQEQMPGNLSVDQLEQLSASTGDGKHVEADKLTEVSGMNKIVFVTVNSEHNQLIVKSSDQGILKSIANLVEQMDIPQTQVMLEMKIIDVKIGEDFSSLFNFEIKDSKIQGDSLKPLVMGGVAALTGGGSFVYEFVSDRVKANIEFLERNNRLNVISNPMLVASNHRPASLFVGEERIMVRGYSVDNVDNINTTRTITTPETELEEIGTMLQIVPHINDDGSIQIQMMQENATLNEAAANIPVVDTTNGGVLNLPVDTITTARMQGEIFAKHGYTVAVGGLIRDSFSRNRRKVPYLADIPLLGNIFRNTEDIESKSEMVLLITPYILNERNDRHQKYDPTDRYHQYAPDIAVQAKPVPKPEHLEAPTCGQYCAPPNLRNSDL